MKKTGILILFILLFSSAVVLAQSDSDTDPGRWKKVKSWEGMFTFFSGPQDDATNTSDPQFITTSNARVTLDGTFILDQNNTVAADFYTWDGQGQVTGSINVKLETRALDGSSDCTTETKSDVPLAPLQNTPGYNLQLDQGQGTYLFSTGVFMIPETITTICDGQMFPPESKDWTIGGADTFTWIALPKAGYHLTGDSVALFNGYNNGHFHWDLKPKEFFPAAPACSFAAALHDRGKLNMLRAARDSMANTPAGIELVYLYYANMVEITGIILRDAELRNRFRALISANIQKARELAEQGAAAIDCEAMQDITSFLHELQTKGSPKLKAAFERVLQCIEDADALHALGVRVTQ
jgi:hypothetical protein